MGICGVLRAQWHLAPSSAKYDGSTAVSNRNTKWFSNNQVQTSIEYEMVI